MIMKTKIFLFLSVVMGLLFTSCNDDVDYTVATNPLLTDGSVVTGSADVTATTATFHGTVSGLGNSSSSSYVVGFNYGTSQSNLNESVSASLSDGVFSAEITGLTTGETIYYQAYVTLQSRLTYTGEIKSIVTTSAQVSQASASAVNHAGATLTASISNATADATYGVVVAAANSSRSRAEASEDVRAGLIMPATSGNADNFTVVLSGLAPNTTYLYAAYADLGSGVVYGQEDSFTTGSYTVDLDTDMVDLGLSVLWAKYNVGATSESDLGGYFGFGDLTGVNNSIDPADYSSSDVYRTANDVANVAWNGAVTLPSAADFEELFNSCSKEWTEVDGVAGYKFTGPNGNSIFLPAAGSRVMNDVSGLGSAGAYATGTINSNNNQFAVSYSFSSSSAQRTSTPVYTGLSVRPVSTARTVAFDKSLLYNTWEIDYNDGASLFFAGPVYFYGTDDSWRTISNGEPVVGDSWAWEADASNTWAFGGECPGSMTINEDGTIEVTYSDGSTQTGTYTIDEENKTITSTIPLLTPSNFPDQCSNLQNELRIFSLVDGMLQIGFYRDSDPCLLSVNYIPGTKKYGFPVVMICVDSNWNGPWDANLGYLQPESLDGLHTLVYEGNAASAMVNTVDIQGLHEAYPNAIVYIKEIRCDGQAITFDQNAMCYGDIEDNGNYRIELFNIWGKNSSNSTVIDSPFSDKTYCDSDDAFHFDSKLEMDIMVITEPASYPVQLITINAWWGGSWDFSNGQTIKPVIDKATAKIVSETSQYDITITSADTDTDYSIGSIMTFINVPGLYADFPGTHCTLDALYLDGNLVTGYDPAGVLDSCDGDAYRFELWNMYGITSSVGCAFGTPVDGVIYELSFSDSMQVQFTLNRFFPAVTW